MADGLLARIRAPLGALRRTIRRRVDTGLHPRRRRRALAGIRERPVPRKILVLCLGNICRSPYVEAYLREEKGDLDFGITSGGFIGPGRPPPQEAVDAAARRGLDTRSHVSRLVDLEALKGVDLVIVVDPSHESRLRETLGAHATPVLVLGDLDPEPGESRTIQDPWGNEPEVFRDVFRRLDRCMEVLLTEWRARSHV